MVCTYDTILHPVLCNSCEHWVVRQSILQVTLLCGCLQSWESTLFREDLKWKHYQF